MNISSTRNSTVSNPFRPASPFKAGTNPPEPQESATFGRDWHETVTRHNALTCGAVAGVVGAIAGGAAGLYQGIVPAVAGAVAGVTGGVIVAALGTKAVTEALNLYPGEGVEIGVALAGGVAGGVVGGVLGGFTTSGAAAVALGLLGAAGAAAPAHSWAL